MKVLILSMGIIDAIQRRLGASREGGSINTSKTLNVGGLAGMKKCVIRGGNRER